MILKASQRSGALNLAVHLLNARDNDHVEVYDIRGLVADDDLRAAFVEMDAQRAGTKAQKPLFSVSFNPPPEAEASYAHFENAIARVEKEFGFEEQARAIVFHEKAGRRHAHVVWSLIDTDRNRALEVKFFKNRMRDISRELYLDHGWTLPAGLQKDRKGRAENYSMAEAQQAKSKGLDPEALKKTVREMLDRSDGLKAFESALAEKGLYLAKGSRGFCVVDMQGGVHALARMSGYKKKEVEAKLGSPDHLPEVEDVQKHVQQQAAVQTRNGSVAERKQKQARERNLLQKDLSDMTVAHLKERKDLRRLQWLRTVTEERSRAERMRGGFIRLFDKVAELLGRKEPTTPKIIGQEREASRRRDLEERDALSRQQRRETSSLHRDLAQMKNRHVEEKEPLERQGRQEPTHERRDPANDHEAGHETQISPVFERAKAAREAKEARRQEGRGRSGGRRYER